VLAVNRAALTGVGVASGEAAAWRQLPIRPPDLSHAERVTLGEPRGETEGPSARATADVRWYRAAQARHAGVASASAPRPAPAPRPVHAGVQAYQRTMALPLE